MEREILSERTKNGLRNAVAKGKKLGAERKFDPTVIQSLASKGMRNVEIAKVIGCSEATISRALRVS